MKLLQVSLLFLFMMLVAYVAGAAIKAPIVKKPCISDIDCPGGFYCFKDDESGDTVCTKNNLIES